jgi:hypothetical protein
MRGSLVINTEEFIRRFWDNFKLEMGGALEVSESAVTDLQGLSQQHDVVVIAAGAGLMQLWGAPLPMLSCVKGQSLIYPGACVSAPVPAAWPWLRSALVPGGYVVWKGGGGGGASDSGRMEGQEEQVVIGATYEHGVDINGSEFCPGTSFV